MKIDRRKRTRYDHTTKVQYEDRQSYRYRHHPPTTVIEFTIIDNLSAKLKVHDSGDFGDIVSIEPAPAPTKVPLIRIPFGK